MIVTIPELFCPLFVHFIKFLCLMVNLVHVRVYQVICFASLMMQQVYSLSMSSDQVL